MQKRKHTFNFIDAFIIILVALVIFAVYFVFFRGNVGDSDDGSDVESVRLQYELQISDLPVEFADNISESDSILDYATFYGAGDIVSVHAEPVMYVGHNKTTGEQVITKDENYVDLYVIVEGDATLINNCYYINKTDIYIGKKINLMMPDLFCSGSCIDVEVIG